MPAIARAEGVDQVQSMTGFGPGCKSPGMTTTGAATESSVFIGGVPVVVASDTVGPHLLSGCKVVDTSTLTTYSSTVTIGGKGVGRVGDMYTSDNVIVTGSSTVFCG